MHQVFVPNLEVQSIYEIDPLQLRALGIDVVLTDLDNTLVRTFEKEAPAELIDWLNRFMAAGLRVMIISNNSNVRVGSFARRYGLPYIAVAKKPLKFCFQKAMTHFNVRSDSVAMIGDQLMTDIFGANRMKLYSIWVHPIERKTDGRWTKINRAMEGVVLKWIRSKQN